MKSKEKTLLALKKAWKSFENLLPQLFSVLIIIGMMLTILSPEQISRFLGGEYGWLGVVAAALIGAVTLIPGFVAFPLAAAMLNNGVGYMQIGAFRAVCLHINCYKEGKAADNSTFSQHKAISEKWNCYIVVAAVMGVLMP